MNIRNQVNALEHMATAELAAKYETLFGKKPRTRLPAWMRKRLAFKIQERALGGLSAPARAAIERLAADIDLPTGATQGPTRAAEAKRSKDELRPGTVLQREWRGQQIRVEVLADGFSWNGERYQSLSAVARAITGSKWNGRLFFGLTERAKQ